MISLKEAAEFTKIRHGKQKRMQGTPYFEHPYAVARILKQKGFSEEYQIAGLFHDLIEDTTTTYEDILDLTNTNIARAVKLVSKEDGYVMKEYMERIKLDDMARMIKLADRLHNLTDAKVANRKFQRKYIKETEEWYLNLAKGTVFEEDINIALGNLRKELEQSHER
mgnify:CR=1 FL=1